MLPMGSFANKAKEGGQVRIMNNLCPISWSTFYAMYHKQYTYIFGKYIIYLYELQKQVTLFSIFCLCKKICKNETLD